jgi:hypothetical protein
MNSLKLFLICSIATFSILFLDTRVPLLAQSAEQNVSNLAIILDKMGPSTVPAGTDLSVLVFVNNMGSGDSSAFSVKLIISPNKEFSENDSELGILFPKPVPAGGSSGIPWQGKLDQPPGTYWVKVCVVPRGKEVSPGSSCTTAKKIVVPVIDLAVSHVEIRPQMIVSGVPVLFRAAIDNRGSQTSDPTKVRYVLSSNPSISRSDPLLVVQEVPAIEAGERWGEPSRGVVKANPGEYWLGACIDPIKGENEASNNCSHGSQIAVVEDVFPDLVIQIVKVRPETWSEGAPVDFYAVVLNSGSKASAPTKVNFYLSENSDITSVDTAIGTAETDSILPDEQFDAYLLVNPSVLPGIYWLGACVEPDDSEFDTFNNCSTGAQVEVTNFQFSE